MPRLRARILNARNRMVPRSTAIDISENMDLGDWWIIYMLGRNLDPIIFKDVLSELAKEIDTDRKPRR